MQGHARLQSSGVSVISDLLASGSSLVKHVSDCREDTLKQGKHTQEHPIHITNTHCSSKDEELTWTPMADWREVAARQRVAHTEPYMQVILENTHFTHVPACAFQQRSLKSTHVAC